MVSFRWVDNGFVTRTDEVSPATKKAQVPNDNLMGGLAYGFGEVLGQDWFGWRNRVQPHRVE